MHTDSYQAEHTALLQYGDDHRKHNRDSSHPFPIHSTLYFFFFHLALKGTALITFGLVLKSLSSKELSLCIPHFCQKKLQGLNSCHRVSLGFLLTSQVLSDSLLGRVSSWMWQSKYKFLTTSKKLTLARPCILIFMKAFLPSVPYTTNIYNQIRGYKNQLQLAELLTSTYQLPLILP